MSLSTALAMLLRYVSGSLCMQLRKQLLNAQPPMSLSDRGQSFIDIYKTYIKTKIFIGYLSVLNCPVWLARYLLSATWRTHPCSNNIFPPQAWHQNLCLRWGNSQAPGVTKHFLCPLGGTGVGVILGGTAAFYQDGTTTKTTMWRLSCGSCQNRPLLLSNQTIAQS